MISSSAPWNVNITINSTNQGNYRVQADSSVVYYGQLYGTSGTQAVDIQPIASNYIPSGIGVLSNWGGTISNAGGPFSTSILVETKTATSWGVTASESLVYCTSRDVINTSDFYSTDLLQWPTKRFLNGSYLGPMGFGSGSLSYSVTYENGARVSNSAGYYSGVGRVAGNLSISDRNGYKPVKMSLSLGTYSLVDNIEIVNCVPKNSFIVYFVNDFGGIVPILCDGTNSVIYNANRTMMKKYTGITTPQQFGRFNYVTNSTRTWKLNTGLIMTDKEAQNMGAFFRSPYVWVYDIDKNKVYSAILEDKSLTVKTFKANKAYCYTLTLSDSIELITRAQ